MKILLALNSFLYSFERNSWNSNLIIFVNKIFWSNNSKFNFSDLRTRNGTMVRSIELRNYVLKHVSVKINLIFTSLLSNSFHLDNGRTGTIFSQSIGAYLVRIEIIKRFVWRIFVTLRDIILNYLFRVSHSKFVTFYITIISIGLDSLEFYEYKKTTKNLQWDIYCCCLNCFQCENLRNKMRFPTLTCFRF